MRVVAEEPWNWLLLEDDRGLYLDVLVEHGAPFRSALRMSSPLSKRGTTNVVAYPLSRLAGEKRHKALGRGWHADPMPQVGQSGRLLQCMNGRNGAMCRRL